MEVGDGGVRGLAEDGAGCVVDAVRAHRVRDVGGLAAGGYPCEGGGGGVHAQGERRTKLRVGQKLGAEERSGGGGVDIEVDQAGGRGGYGGSVGAVVADEDRGPVGPEDFVGQRLSDRGDVAARAAERDVNREHRILSCEV